MIDEFVDKKIADEVCRIGQGALCCRYLTMGRCGWSCEKATELRDVIDLKVVAGDFTARGDNCEGRRSR